MDILITLVLGAVFGAFIMSLCVAASRESRKEEQADPCSTCPRWEECNGVTFSTDNNDVDKLTPTADNLPAVQKWIPVTERLPEKDEIILVYNSVHKEYTMGKFWYLDQMKGDVLWVDTDHAPRWGTHWMTLPKLPKED